MAQEFPASIRDPSAIQGETLSAKAALVQPFNDHLSRIIEEEA